MHNYRTTYPADNAAKRWLHFSAAIVVFGLVVFVLAPLPIKYYGPMAHYVHNAQQNDINPGSLYYTDVSVSKQAEFNSRNAVRSYYDSKR